MSRANREQPMLSPRLLEMSYNETTQDLYLRWDQLNNTTPHEIQLFNCNNTILDKIQVNASCSSALLSGVNSVADGLLLLAVKDCHVDSCSGPDGLGLMNVGAINFTSTCKGMYLENCTISCTLLG